MHDLVGSWFPGGSTLTTADFAVLAVALALMLWLGRRAGRMTRSPADFFLAGRRVPAVPVMLSFLSTEVSAMTVIGLPAVAFRDNWNSLQAFFGSAAARVFIAFVFLPAFYRHGGTTIYEYLKTRFGRRTHRAAVGFFFVTRLLASGARLMMACVAAGLLLGLGLGPTVVLFTAVSVLALISGGIESTVWTNVWQSICFLGAGVLSILFLLRHIDGGLPAAVRLASGASKLLVFRWSPATSGGSLGRILSDPGFFWVAVLNGFFGSAAAFGTDHEMTQKLLTAPTVEESQKALLLSIAGALATLLIYMGVGTLLFVFYKQNPGMALPDRIDQIYPHFAATAMPRFLRGAVLTALVMASIDSPLAALSAVFVTDVYRPWSRRRPAPTRDLKIARLSMVGFALALAGVALFFNSWDDLLWVPFKIGGVTYGPLLGIFLLGLLTERRVDGAAAAAMLFMAGLNAVLLVLSASTLGWSWLIVLGAAGTFGLGWAFGRTP